MAETPLSAPQQPRGHCHCINQSQADTILQRYSGGGIVGTNKISTREGTDERLYPYNPGFPEYLSKFPVGFGYCFKYGNPSYYRRNEFPQGRDNSPDVMGTFWRELKVHKPHFEHIERTWERGCELACKYKLEKYWILNSVWIVCELLILKYCVNTVRTTDTKYCINTVRATDTRYCVKYWY